ncbi:MAG: beta-galactosidase [Candidatus Sumerlaeota bacterium]|nr:beta-galactosidase [Candidatus Sumerlaeota bacterium]
MNSRLDLVSIWLVLLCALPRLAPGPASAAEEKAASQPAAGLRGKAGFYLRLPEGQREKDAELYLTHPLVDAAVCDFKWSQLEPREGQYDFSPIDQMLELCKTHGKGLVLEVSTYGQSPGAQPTPDWLYGKGVKAIRFSGGGVAKGRDIDVPKVWEGPYLEIYGRFIRRLAERYNGNPTIWFVMPGYGHIGNLNAQPSAGGGPAFLAEGWTPDKWKEFCRRVTGLWQEAFPATPLLVKSAPQFLRDKRHDNYLKEANELLGDLAAMHVSIITFGLTPNLEQLKDAQVCDRLAALEPLAMCGAVRLGIGDDWPLWIPEERRKNEKFIADRDENGLRNELNYAFGGVEGLPATHVSMMYVLHPEIGASHPQLGAEQNKALYEILAAARQRLKEDDPIAELAP